MKTLFKLSSLFLLLVAFVACSDDDNDEVTTQFAITSITPESGPVGTEITVRGSNFPSDVSAINLTIGGVPATITSATSTQIVTSVPAGATSGTVSVTIDGVSQSTPTSFTVLSDLVSGTVENLFAPQTGGQGEEGEISGEFTKFSFATGAETTSDTDWDIAFRGTTIAVNGGVATGTNDEPTRNGDAAAVIVEGIFSEINSADGLTFAQDADAAFAIPTGSNNGWYNYNFMTNLITPIPGVILVFRTHDGLFAKVEILSYYEDAPANPDGFNDPSRYYTFNYVFNPNEGETSLASN
nr:IPT/TIG domain-containing protein [Allomuricauda sp.]